MVEFKASLRYIVKLFQNKKKTSAFSVVVAMSPVLTRPSRLKATVLNNTKHIIDAH